MSNDPVKPVQTEGLQATVQAKRNWAAQEVLGRTEEALNRQLRNNWSTPVLEGLDRKLAAFESALGSFSWPTDPPPWFQARLVTGSSETQGKVSGTVRSAARSTPEVKIVSGGFDASSPTSISAGDYTFNLSNGGYTEALSVNVSSSDSWGDVLGKVKNAVNAAPLAVRADVVYQNAAFQLNPDMAGTGSVLALSVNPNRPAQDLSIKDTSGSLLSQLRLRAAGNPIGPAEETGYQVTGLQQARPTMFSSTPVDPRAATSLALGRHDLAYSVGNSDQPSTYISKVYDPSQATTLAAGTYSFTSTYAGEQRAHSVTIGTGWTWGDVLRTVGAEVNAHNSWVNTSSPTLAGPSTTYSQPGVEASVGNWPIPSTTQPGVNTDGQSLTITGAAGQEFSLSDTSGGLLNALGLTTKLTGTPVSFNVNSGDTWQDVYDSMSTSINGSQLSFSAKTIDKRIPSTVTPGKNLWHQGVSLALIQENQRIGERVSLSDGRTGALDSIGILSRERPGQDGKLIVNGREQVSENGTFSQGQGRVLLNLEQNFGETLPLSVTSGMDEVEKGWGRITDAWNGLAKYLSNNSDMLDHSLGAKLEAPLAAQKQNLGWLGVSSAGKQGQLWTNLDSFWKSLYADTDRAKTTLWEYPDGLVPAWQDAMKSVRSAGLDSWLKPKTAFDEYRPNITSEFELEQKHRLVKLLG
ncbi:MAG: hypothetical protein HY795_07515 [Desulfovibrio sp.]|nr:hypothetical protein [Desulfovibrio sp.]MBI4960842.1 hypothetical protein [Desulfovibrio sp.]